MRAGDLRHRIDIQVASLSDPDENGERESTWATVDTRSASIEPISGREVLVARSYAPTVSHKITFRRYPGLLLTHRLAFGQRVFGINSIINTQERNRELVVYATELVGRD